MSLKDKILAVRRVTPLEVPELGFKVYLKAMTGADADVYDAAAESAQAAKSTVGLNNLLVSLTLCDEKGQLLFASPEEAAGMDEKAILRIVHKAYEINGLTKDFRDELEKKVQPETKALGTELPKN